jgi:cyclic-di-GMP phosphodiesterase, flagellum assembly factor TipF
VVDLLDFDVRFGQGFLFAPPRPLRPEGASATGDATANKAEPSSSNGSHASNGSGRPAPVAGPATEPPPRTTGNAALARRAAGPG